MYVAWKESHYALGIFRDLSKEFDCIYHSIPQSGSYTIMELEMDYRLLKRGSPAL